MTARHRADQPGYRVSPAELADMLEVAASVLRAQATDPFQFEHRDTEAITEISYAQVDLSDRVIGFTPNPDRS